MPTDGGVMAMAVSVVSSVVIGVVVALAVDALEYLLLRVGRVPTPWKRRGEPSLADFARASLLRATTAGAASWAMWTYGPQRVEGLTTPQDWTDVSLLVVAALLAVLLLELVADYLTYPDPDPATVGNPGGTSRPGRFRDVVRATSGRARRPRGNRPGRRSGPRTTTVRTWRRDRAAIGHLARQYGVWPLLATVLALTLVGLLHGRPVPEVWPGPAWRVSVGWSLLASVLGLGLLVLGAYDALTKQGPAARVTPWLVPSLAVVDAVLIGVYLPEQAPDAAQRWIRYAVAAGLTVVGLKLLLLHRYTRLDSHYTRLDSHETQDETVPFELLSSRRQDASEVARLVRRGQRPDQVIPISGRWGEGKSALLHALKDEWTTTSDVAYVIVDVWQLESEGDLQVRVIDALLHHPAYLRGLRWLGIPIGFTLALPTGQLRQTIQALRLKLQFGKNSGMEAELRMPQLRWQRTFDRITSRCDAKRTVIALDEVDRATPSATQAALTFARRSAARPSVAILLPYTRELIRYKAFNPLLEPLLPDLASSMEAVIFDEVVTRSGTAVVSDGSRLGDLSEALRASYAALDPRTRARLQSIFEEKYLGPEGVQMRPPSVADVLQLLRTNSRLEQVTDIAQLGSQSAVDSLLTGLQNGWATAVGDGYVTPPARSLEQLLSRLLSECAPARLGPQELAVMALVAVDLGKKPEKGAEK